MAARLALRRHAPPAAAALLASTTLLLYPRSAFAESPDASARPITKKPIYDDQHSGSAPQKTSLPPTAASFANSSFSSSSSSSTPSEPQPESEPAPPLPTDRLATQIRSARLGLYRFSQSLEDKVNDGLSRALHVESNVANTIASLAPPRTANEPLVPGLTYTLVAMLAGSIFTRNRGIILRFSVPATLGLAAANAAMPVTVANVGDLLWKWEEQYPQIAQAHIQTKERIQQFWETGKDHTAMTKDMITDKVDEARKGVEDWVKKGK